MSKFEIRSTHCVHAKFFKTKSGSVVVFESSFFRSLLPPAGGNRTMDEWVFYFFSRFIKGEECNLRHFGYDSFRKRTDLCHVEKFHMFFKYISCL